MHGVFKGFFRVFLIVSNGFREVLGLFQGFYINPLKYPGKALEPLKMPRRSRDFWGFQEHCVELRKF